jgi:hypothetical protein
MASAPCVCVSVCLCVSVCTCAHQALEVMLGLKVGKPGDEDMGQSAAAAEQGADSGRQQQASAAAASSSGGGSQQQHQQQANGSAEVRPGLWLVLYCIQQEQPGLCHMCLWYGGCPILTSCCVSG